MKKQIILLNGPSSSGKSTLARALRELIFTERGEEYGIVSIDDHMKISEHETIYEDDVYDISGDMCESIANALNTAPGVIVDHVITSERIFRRLEETALPFRLVSIRVECPLEVLRERERERGDRSLGSAEASYTYLFPKDGYDLTVNTHEMTPEECARKIFRYCFPSETDAAFVFGNRRFKYRVCAVILSKGRILAMRDEVSPYYYLPGGKVRLGETAERALVREIEEELCVAPRIVRPLWLNQSFFQEDVNSFEYHELCLYFLMDVSGTGLENRGEKFTLYEGKHTHDFEWLPLERLKDEYFYPVFIKTAVFDLPEHLELRAEYE